MSESNCPDGGPRHARARLARTTFGARSMLLCERGVGPKPRTKHYLVALPPTASLKALVRPAHQRFEQQYQELTTELGLDHFEGRSYSAGTDTSG